MKDFQIKVQQQFDRICTLGKLFRSKLTGQQVWDLYISSFPQDSNPIFRDPESTTHNCNLCKNFLRRYGNVVAIDENYQIVTMFDNIESAGYTEVAAALSNVLKANGIGEVFFETFTELNSLPYESCSKSNTTFKLGIDRNIKRYTKEEAEKFGVVKPNELRTFNHLYLQLPAAFVYMESKSVESIMADYRDAKNVFLRAMETISLDTFNLVKDLIHQGSLLDGQTHLYKIEQIVPLALEFQIIPNYLRDNWAWVKSYKLPFAKFKNELIGVLCTELAEGKELNEACQAWNKRVDPANYMKATAPITKRQIEEAQIFVEENGYVESFNRRFATIDDIRASEILHVNVGNGALKQVSIFDGVRSTSTRHKRTEFDKVEEVSIETFMQNILPSCTSVEAFLINSHEGNMVSLTTSKVKESKPIFKWDNNYSWTFNGNLAGKSQIKEAVKNAGGRVDGVLRFSIMWSGDGIDNSDLDAHCIEPNTHEIYYGDKRSSTGGNLDIDITQPLSQMPKGAVENIIYPRVETMPNGAYKFFIHQFNSRNSKGFKAEIEVNGELYSYEYNNPVAGKIHIAKVTLSNGKFTINHVLVPTDGVGVSKEIYGLNTGEFHKVNLICLSPNHWEPNNVGNKHYFFMLDGANTPVSIRSFHAENLIPELATHRKVLEVLGNTTMIAPADPQLTGLGFNATVRDELIVRLQGTHKRVVKINF